MRKEGKNVFSVPSPVTAVGTASAEKNLRACSRRIRLCYEALF